MGLFQPDAGHGPADGLSASARGPVVISPISGGPAEAAGGATLLTDNSFEVQTPVRPTAKRVILVSAALLAMLSGTLDATANALFTFGLSVGDLAVLSVVSGFYPAVTIGLAFFILKERPNRMQSIGIVLSLVSLVGMALA